MLSPLLRGVFPETGSVPINPFVKLCYLQALIILISRFLIHKLFFKNHKSWIYIIIPASKYVSSFVCFKSFTPLIPSNRGDAEGRGITHIQWYVYYIIALLLFRRNKYMTLSIQIIPNVKFFKITFIYVHFFACPKKRTKERAPRSNRDPFSQRHFPGISNTPVPSPYEIPFRKMPCSPGDSSRGFFTVICLLPLLIYLSLLLNAPREKDFFIMSDKICILFNCRCGNYPFEKPRVSNGFSEKKSSMFERADGS